MKNWLRLTLLILALIGAAGLAEAAQQVAITINKVSQKMMVKVDDELTYVWPVSTGASGYDTPSGKFRPFRMEKDHFSKEWDDAPMPHSIFFTPRGHAIHGSMYVKSLGRRASHGCVRIAPANAAKLYALVDKVGMQNTTITLRGGFFDGGYINEIEIERTANTVKKKIKKSVTSLERFLGGLN
jgi:L,D-transpeptidase catalytic domain